MGQSGLAKDGDDGAEQRPQRISEGRCCFTCGIVVSSVAFGPEICARTSAKLRAGGVVAGRE